MDLSTTQQILLIILSSALAVFLILGIAVLVMVIRFVQTLRTIAAKAEHIVETASHVGDMFKSVSSPVGVFRFIKGVAEMVHKDSKRGK